MTDSTQACLPPGQKRYILQETCIGIIISAALSVFFVWLIFNDSQSIGLWGTDGLAVDFLPQTFMITFMCILVPSFIARKRRRSGGVDASSRKILQWLPTSLPLRALLLALLATVVFSGIGILVLHITPMPMPLNAVYLFKILYGSIVAMIMAPIGLLAVLGE